VGDKASLKVFVNIFFCFKFENKTIVLKPQKLFNNQERPGDEGNLLVLTSLLGATTITTMTHITMALDIMELIVTHIRTHVIVTLIVVMLNDIVSSVIMVNVTMLCAIAINVVMLVSL
jgi:hypothetical protein